MLLMEFYVYAFRGDETMNEMGEGLTSTFRTCNGHDYERNAKHINEQN